jgi:hypothetical protein
MKRILAVFLLALASTAHAEASSSACLSEPLGHALDFWLGDWSVRLRSGLPAGTNRVERILRGCAVVETWHDIDGTEGRSLFTFDPSAKRWKQVWVTDDAGAPGGLKEKRLVARYGDGSTRFQGEIVLPGGDVLLDRTTLTPQADGTVRQLIEISKDGGSTWRAAFDAVYEKRAKPD